MTTVIDLGEKLSTFEEHWSPRVLAELNGQHVRVAKLHGAFVWHRHEREDELFLVLAGELLMHLREEGVERVERLGPGQMLVIPHGVEHLPEAPEEVHVLLFEPASTVNTGNADDPRRVERPERL